MVGYDLVGDKGGGGSDRIRGSRQHNCGFSEGRTGPPPIGTPTATVEQFCGPPTSYLALHIGLMMSHLSLSWLLWFALDVMTCSFNPAQP